jgi:hypothetical protein
MKFLLHYFTRWQSGEVLRHVDAAFAEFQQLNLLLLFTSTQDNA